MHQASCSCRRGVLITVDDSASLVLSVLHQTVHSIRQLRRRPRRDSHSSSRASGVYSHLLGRDGNACQWPSRPAAGYCCLRGLFARAPDAQELQWLTSCLSFLWRSRSPCQVHGVHGRSVCDFQRRLPSLFVVAPARSALCPSRRVSNNSSNFVFFRPDHQSRAPRQ